MDDAPEVLDAFLAMVRLAKEGDGCESAGAAAGPGMGSAGPPEAVPASLLW
jgi:hypothetical protein